jgi:hypothetical protein
MILFAISFVPARISFLAKAKRNFMPFKRRFVAAWAGVLQREGEEVQRIAAIIRDLQHKTETAGRSALQVNRGARPRV